MEEFRYREEDLNINHREKTAFESLMEATWSEAMNCGSFKYTLQDLESKILPGKRQFIVQLNKRRFEERRKPQLIHRLNEPSDASKFSRKNILSNC